MFISDALAGDEPYWLDEDDAFVPLDRAGGAGRPPAEVAGLAASVSGLRAALQAITAEVGRGLGRVADVDVVAALGELQRLARAVVPLDAALVGELARRGLHERHGYPTVAAMLVGECRVRPAEAAQRVGAARRLVPRADLLGQRLPPVRPVVAAALVDGAIGLDHAVTVDRALDALPPTVGSAEVGAVEQALTDLARTRPPGEVATAARHVHALYDPDGTRPHEHLDRRRSLRLSQHDDGTGELRGVLTPECLAAVQAVLHPLAAPHTRTDAAADADGRPAPVSGPDGGVPDARTAPQRLHDALLDAAMRLLGSGTLPDAGGSPVTIAVTMTVDELHRGAGLATTEYGTTVPVARLLDLAAEADYLPTLLRPTGGVLDYGTARRCAPPAMARALRARDRGCTFPGCTRPAAWTERHHVYEHRHGGPTALGNLVLVCRYHHRAFARHGWQVTMRDGRPWWIPPADVDPDQRPRRNTHWDTPVP